MASATGLQDTVTIPTPEGVELTLALAGLGSRFIAGATDLIIQELVCVLIAVLTGVAGGSAGLNAAAFLISSFLVVFAYPILFEVFASGRTPGKRFTHLRVLREGGLPVDLPASATRNLVRVLDGLTLFYLPTIIGIIGTRNNQRPGDVAAGTLVVRDPERPARRRRRRLARSSRRSSAVAVPAPDAATAEGWDVSAITPAELAAVRRFLARRDGLDRAARAALSVRLAEGLRGKVAGAPRELPAERFLELLAATKAAAR